MTKFGYLSLMTELSDPSSSGNGFSFIRYNFTELKYKLVERLADNCTHKKMQLIGHINTRVYAQSYGTIIHKEIQSNFCNLFLPGI